MNAAERSAWLEERRTGIGGSDVAAILGLSPWQTAVGVWLDKTGRTEPQPETEAMRIGSELEDFVARRYEERTGRTVRRYNRMIHRGCLLGNVDRLVVPEGAKVASHMGEIRTDTLLECKTSSRDWTDGVPIYYQTQVQHYMGLDERLEHADVAVLFLVHKGFDVIRVERDDAVIREIQERMTAWWDRYVVGGEMPPPATEEDCKALWAVSNPGKTITADDDLVETVCRYRALAADAAEAEEKMKGLRDRICAAMGDAETLADANGFPMVTWKSSKPTRRTDWRAVAAELVAPEEVVARHTYTVPGARRFLVNAKLL